jgi:hypothetical protein
VNNAHNANCNRPDPAEPDRRDAFRGAGLERRRFPAGFARIYHWN